MHVQISFFATHRFYDRLRHTTKGDINSRNITGIKIVTYPTKAFPTLRGIHPRTIVVPEPRTAMPNCLHKSFEQATRDALHPFP